MPNKYKVHPLRINLLAVAAVLALWTPAAPPAAALVLWISISWFFITALLIEFSHRRAHGLPWQLFPGMLLIGLIAAAPERHVLLVWAWVAFFMLPQPYWVTTFNISGMLLSMILITPQLGLPTWAFMLLTLCILCLIAMSRARQLTLINGDILQRLRLMPGLNLWAREQLLRDLKREQLRCERESIHGELLLFHVKRRQLWPMAPKLCHLIYGFENAYRFDAHTLATILLSRSPSEAAERRQLLAAAFPSSAISQYIELADIELDPLDLHALNTVSPKNINAAARQQTGEL